MPEQKKPLVIYGTQVTELLPGDTLDAPVMEVDVVNKINGGTSTMTVGQAVYMKSDGTVALAQANASATTNVYGFVKSASVAVGGTATIQLSGEMTGFTGLTPGARYFLSAATPGAITTTPTTTPSQFVAPVGVTGSATSLKINVLTTILLS